MKTILAYLAVLLAGLALIWVLAANSLGLAKVFNPAFEDVRRETFEHSKAYRDGANQELQALRVEYLKADPVVRPALASAIRHKAAGLPDGTLPSDLAYFIKDLP
jgi:hypothetical protein